MFDGKLKIKLSMENLALNLNMVILKLYLFYLLYFDIQIFCPRIRKADRLNSVKFGLETANNGSYKA